MANGGRIDYTIGFNVDKGGLKDLENTLKDLNKMSASNIMKENPGMSMKESMSAMVKLRQSIAEVQGAYNKAFDSKIGVLNIEKMQSSLKKLDLNTIQKNFAAIGPKGSEAFLKISQSALTANIRFKETNSLINKMGTTLINTLKWTFSSSLINRFTGSIQQAVGYVEHLDRSLNDIRIVTKKSADEMEQFGQQANKAAQALGKATTDYTEAALIYYQQGLSDEEVKARAETTLKAANVTGQATKTVSEQLTAVWNGFRVNAEQTEEYVDKLAAVAAMSASDLEELSTGMSKVASAAANLGVDIDQLSAQISTIVSVTRQAPESVGTALKTIYARISDLKLGETDEDGLGLGDVSGGLEKLGIHVLDSEGELRDLGTVIEEVAEKWNTWTSAQQAAIAQLMAGKRQYNNLVALFSNWDMYTNAIETSRNATGELQKQQDIYMESTEAHIQQLKTQWEDLYDSVIDPDAIIGGTDALNGILTVITKIVDSIGGGSTLITGLLGTVLNKFGPQITQQVLMPLINNFKAAKENAAAFAQITANTQYMASQNGFGHEATQEMLNVNKELFKVWQSMTTEEKNESQELVQQIGYWKEKQNQINKAAESTNKYLQKLSGGMDSIGKKGVFNLSDADQQQAITYLENQQKALNTLKKNYEDIEKVSKKFVKGDKGKFVVTPQELTNLNTGLKAVKNNLDSLKNAKIISSDEYDRNIKSLEKIAARIAEVQGGKGNSRSTVFTQQETKELEKLFNTLGLINPELEKHLQVLKEGKVNSKEYAEALDNVNRALNMEGKQTKQRVQNVTQTIGAITQLMSVMQSLSNVMTTVGDESVDIGEKIKTIFSSLIYIVPSLISAFSTLSKTLKLTAPEIAGIAIAITAVVGTISFMTSALSSARKATAESAKNLADASTKVTEAAVEEKKAVDNLIDSYEALDQTSITYRDDLRQLLIDQGKFTEAAKTATASLEELDEIMKQLQKDANDKVIESATNQIDRLRNAITADINANVLSETERDTENNIDTIDLGGQVDTNSIKNILDEFNIDVVTESGHINLQQFVNAMVENEAVLRKALQENNSDAARRLLEIMGQEQEMLTTTAEALTQKQEAQLSNLQQGFSFGGTSYKEYEQAYEDLYEKAKAIYGKDNEAAAESWTKKRIAETGELGTAFAGLKDKTKEVVQTINRDLTAAELNYLNDNIETYYVYGQRSAEEFLNGAQEIIDGEEGSYLLVSISLALNKEQLEDEDISSLFSNGPIKDLTEGEFRLFDTQKQKRELRKYFNSLLQEQEKYNKELLPEKIKGLKADQDATKEHYDKLIEIADKYNIQLNNVHSYEDSKIYEDRLAEKQDRLLQIDQEIENAWNDDRLYVSNDNIKQRIQNLENERIAIEKQIPQYEKRIQAAKEFEEVNKEVEESAQEYIDAYQARADAIDKNIAKIAGQSKELSDSIKNIQDLESAHNAGAILDTDYTERYMQLNREQDIEGLDTKELEDYTKYLQETAKASDELADSLEDDGDAADIVAKSIMKMNKAIEELSDGFEEWSDILQNSEESSEEYSQALSKMRASVADLLDISEDYISKNFMIQNLEDIGLAAEGDAEAIDRLRNTLAQDIALNLELKDERFRQQVIDTITQAQADIDAMGPIEAGTRLGTAGWIDALNQMIIDTGMSVDQINAMLDSLGFEAQVETKPIPITGQVPVTVKRHVIEHLVPGENGMPSSWTEKEYVSTDYEPADGETMAFAMTTDGSAPQIKTVTKKASGSMNNFSSKNAGGKKSSGGGGGGGSKGKEPSKEKSIERDTDIYRVVNQELSQVKSQLEDIDKINSHQWGISYKKTLEQQNKLLKQQTELLKKKNKLQTDDLSTRRKQLEDVGVQFSEDGAVMLNAEEYLNELYLKHNALIEAYNKMSASEQEVAKADLETDKNRIDAIEKKIDEYESLYKEYEDIKSQLLEQHYAEIENEVAQFNAMVDVHLELKDAEKEWNDFWKEVIEDVKDTDFGGQIASSMKQLNTLIGVDSGFAGSTGDILVNHIHDTIAEVDKMLASAGEKGLFKDDIKKAKENLETYRDQLMSTLREAKEEIDNIAENYIKQLEYSWELIDKQVERFEAIGKHLNHNLELIKLIDGEKAFDAIDTQYENQYENNLELLNTLRQSKDIVEQQMKDQKALMEQYEKGTIERETATEAYEKSVDEYLKITEKLDSTLEDTLNAIKEQTENANAKILDTLDKAMSKGIGLDLVEEEWKLINDEANKYYDNVERYINMEEYAHQLNDAANAIGLSAENQQKLNDFRDKELKQLNEKERLTSYDIEESKARLEILKQELALQDAQANKSKMRLRRDSQGNYNYQYVADEGAVDQAENGVLTAKKEWYSIVKNRYQELSNDIIAIQKQQLEYAKEIKDAEAAGDIERLNKYKELYNKNAEYLSWAMEEAEKNKRDMYDGTQLYFAEVDDKTLMQSETTIRQLVDDWVGGGEDSFTGAIVKAVQDLDAAQQKFKEQTDAALSAAGTDYTKLKEDNIDLVLSSLKDLTDKELFDKLKDINDELKDQWKNLVDGAEAYRAFKEKAVAELNAVIEKLKALAEQINNMPTYDSGISSASSASDIDYASGSSVSSGNSPSGSGSGNNKNTNSTTPTTTTPKITYRVVASKILSGNPPRQIDHFELRFSDSKRSAGLPDAVYSSIEEIIRDIKKKDKRLTNADGTWHGVTPPKFRSGGYTGEWGNEGRLGILHQKELVLNENDTKNMLSAVQILRSIPYSVIAQSLINSSTNTASALSGINSGISGLAAAATNNESKTMVVNADFSGVHDADEIYQALLELENYGLQNSYSVAPHANSMY